MNERRTRRLKDKRPMFPFGQLMLPVIGVVAIGLLVIGVKLFFFGQPEPPVIVAVPQTGAQEEFGLTASPAPADDETAERTAAPVRPAVPSEGTPGGTASPKAQVIAVPVAEGTTTAAAQPVPQASDREPRKTDPRPAQGGKGTGTSPAPSNSSWGVQIGAFSTKGAAETLLTRARTQGFNGRINQARVNGKTFYRVQIPSGNSRETARALSEKLKTKGFPTLIVTMKP